MFSHCSFINCTFCFCRGLLGLWSRMTRGQNRLKNPRVCLFRTTVRFSIFMWDWCNTVLPLPAKRTAYCWTLNIIYLFNTVYFACEHKYILLTVGTAVLSDCSTAHVRCIKEFPRVLKTRLERWLIQCLSFRNSDVDVILTHLLIHHRQKAYSNTELRHYGWSPWRQQTERCKRTTNKSKPKTIFLTTNTIKRKGLFKRCKYEIMSSIFPKPPSLLHGTVYYI